MLSLVAERPLPSRTASSIATIVHISLLVVLYPLIVSLATLSLKCLLQLPGLDGVSARIVMEVLSS